MSNLGVLTLLPPILIIIVAITSKKTTSSLLIGVIFCCILQYGWHFIDHFINLIYRVGTAEDTVWIIIFTALFGVFIQLISVSKGDQAFLNIMSKVATSPKKTMIASWIAGIIVFFDDFTSVLIRGMMTKLFDRQRIPRAMLSYITDATASPLCIFIPFGTWAVFYQSLFSGYDEVTSLGPVMDTYIKAIPLMFYGWVSLIISFLVACQIIKPIGGMRRAYERAEKTGMLFSEESKSYNIDNDIEIEELNKKNFFKSAVCFIVPVLVLIVVALVTMDALKAVIITTGIMIPLYLIVGNVKWKEMMNASMKGVESMTSMCAIVFMAYMLKEAITDIGLPSYVISIVQPIMSIELLPLITFMACVFLTFTTGSNWGGTVGVTAIVIPLASSIGANMPLILAAIISGAAFGAHVCFYTDVTVFTSTITKIDNQEHAITQLPYGIIGMVISALAYLIAGYLIA